MWDNSDDYDAVTSVYFFQRGFIIGEQELVNRRRMPIMEQVPKYG